MRALTPAGLFLLLSLCLSGCNNWYPGYSFLRDEEGAKSLEPQAPAATDLPTHVQEAPGAEDDWSALFPDTDAK